MLKVKTAFSGISVDNLDEAKRFYIDILGLDLKDDKMGLKLQLPSGGDLFIYAKDGHQPATYTVLNFVVDNIDEAVDELVKQGISFESYDDMPTKQDDKKIFRGLANNQGPDIAWFKDPAGNILSIIQDK